MSEDAQVFSGKVALITGAAGGMGEAVCAMLARDGARVIGFDRAAVPAEFEGAPEIRECDVGDEGQVAAGIEAIGKQFDRLDFVVHCAAIPQGNVVWKLPVDEWDRILRVNLRSAFLLAHHGIPLMRRSGDGGRIAMIGSTSGSCGRFGQSAYAASKAGLIGLAKSVARETARHGILVNVIEPGIIETPMSLGMPDDLRERAISETPMGKMGQPADIAEAVRYLCGPGGRHVTGQILRVDGGEYM